MPTINQLPFVVILLAISVGAIILNVLSTVDIMKGKASSFLSFAPDISLAGCLIAVIITGIWMPLAIDVLVKRICWGPIKSFLIDRLVMDDVMGQVDQAMKQLGITDPEGTEIMAVGTPGGEIKSFVIIDKQGRTRTINIGETNGKVQDVLPSLPDEQLSGEGIESESGDDSAS